MAGLRLSTFRPSGPLAQLWENLKTVITTTKPLSSLPSSLLARGYDSSSDHITNRPSPCSTPTFLYFFYRPVMHLDLLPRQCISCPSEPPACTCSADQSCIQISRFVISAYPPLDLTFLSVPVMLVQPSFASPIPPAPAPAAAVAALAPVPLLAQ